MKRLSNVEIARIFGCTEKQVADQRGKNRKQLEAMYEQAWRTHKKVNGFTAEQLRQMARGI